MQFDSKRNLKRLSSGASVPYSERDWAKVTGTAVKMGGRNWPVGMGIGKAAGTLQTQALAVYANTGEALVKIQAERDLTDDAKARRSIELLDAAAESLAVPFAALTDAFAGAAEAARDGFDPTRPLAPTDAVSAAQDVELRGIIRVLPASERMHLLADAAAGKQPAITAAVLRGAPIASGMSADAFDQLKSAGVVAANIEALEVIKALVTQVAFDSVHTAKAVAKSLAEIGKVGHHAALANAVSGQPDKPMREYLQSLPLGA